MWNQVPGFGSFWGTYILIMITCLIVKHYIVDFTCLQTPWMYLNKGKYGHPGGLAHAWLHAVVSLPVFMWCSLDVTRMPEYCFFGLNDGQLLVVLFWFEFLVHYHMDWFKIWFGKRRKWSEYIPVKTLIPPHLAIYSNNYFNLLGVDQLVHYLTYVAMIIIWIW